MQADELKQTIRSIAARLGFDACHVSRPAYAAKHVVGLDTWIESGMQADMRWMAEGERLLRHRNAASLLPDVRSTLSLAIRYSPPPYGLPGAEQATDRGVISAYAHGADYHNIMKPRLKAMARELDALLGRREQRVYVDTAPVLEHALAEGSGLGWQGKHSLTLNRTLGSWFLLGEIFTTAELEPDSPASFHCGSCTACIDVCPTQAIVAPFVVDARRCISYLTIEHKGSIPRDLRPLIGNRIYGCDDCQVVCPWNGDATAPENDLLEPRGENCLPLLARLLELDEASFRARFSKSPVKRIGRVRFLRNCCIAAGNSGKPALQTQLMPLVRDTSELVREHAVWALGRLCDPSEATSRLAQCKALLASENDEQVREELGLTINELKEKT